MGGFSSFISRRFVPESMKFMSRLVAMTSPKVMRSVERTRRGMILLCSSLSRPKVKMGWPFSNDRKLRLAGSSVSGVKGSVPRASSTPIATPSLSTSSPKAWRKEPGPPSAVEVTVTCA